MYKFDIKSIRFIALSLFICIIFTCVVMQAYKYIPENSTNESQVTTRQYTEQEAQKLEEDDFSEEDNDVEAENINKPEIEPLEVIEEENIKSISDLETKADNIYSKAENYVKSNNFDNAIKEYKTIASNSNNNEVKANCYEQIARIYAYTKDYKSALEFAQTSYGYNPTTEIEVLIARLYYKNGDTDKANYRIGQVLRKDFSL